MKKLELILDLRSKEYGFRNFTSFVFTCYYGNKKSAVECSRILKVGRLRFHDALESRGWPIRNKSQSSRFAKKPKKRKLYIYQKTRMRTPYIFPWCAIHTYYWKYLMTTYEVAKALGISQTSVLKLMRIYGIKRRNQGKRKFR